MAKAFQRATMRDVADRANVSVGTVSRVINNKPSVQPELRSDVLAAMRALNYEPSLLARSMRTRVTHSIGCMIPSIASPIFSQSVEAAEEVFSDRGYTLMLTNTYGRPKREADLLTFLRRRQVDGVLAAISTDSDEDVLGEIASLGVPIVLLQRSLRITADAVGVDYYGGVATALSHLSKFGHRRVGIVVGRTGIPLESRLGTLRDIHLEAGLEFDPGLVQFCDTSDELPFIRTRELMGLAARPTAVIAGSGQIASVLRALGSVRVSVPHDVSIVSLGENDLTTLYDPAITSIRWDNAEVGRIAAHLLLERINTEAAPDPVSYVVPGDLVARASTAPAQPSLVE